MLKLGCKSFESVNRDYIYMYIQIYKIYGVSLTTRTQQFKILHISVGDETAAVGSGLVKWPVEIVLRVKTYPPRCTCLHRRTATVPKQY